MAQGLITEWEWRRMVERSLRGHNRCWGAQCVQPKPAKLGKGKLAIYMLCASLCTAMLIPLAASRTNVSKTYQIKEIIEPAPKKQVTARKLSTVGYVLPEGMESERKTFTREEMLRGTLMLLDEDHPLPEGAPIPNTMSVVSYGKGMVPVSDLTVRSGQETIKALTGLFASLRGTGVGCFTVCRGTQTPFEQKQSQLQYCLHLARNMPLEQAALKTLIETETPGKGELIQEFTVELSLTGGWTEEKPELAQIKEGRTLLQTAWRYGFVHEPKPDRWRLRYVGKPHAAAMVFLNLNLEDYLQLLHEKEILQIKLDASTTYLILCQPMGGEYVEFLLPKGAQYEVSFDNLGYAVVACTIENR